MSTAQTTFVEDDVADPDEDRTSEDDTETEGGAAISSVTLSANGKSVTLGRDVTAQANPDLIAQIISANRKFKEAEATHVDLKEQTKAAKEEMDGCARLVSRLITQMETDDDRPLFKDLDKPAVDPALAWRTESIDVLGLTPSVAESLRRGDIATLGELADLIAMCDEKGSEGKPADLWPTGIGPKKQEQIIESIKLWQDNNSAQDSRDVPVEPLSLPPEVADWEGMSEKQQNTWLEGRAAPLRELTRSALEDRFPDHLSNAAFVAGSNAQEDGDTLLNCPYAPASGTDQPGVGAWDLIDAWIAGWLWEEKEDA